MGSSTKYMEHSDIPPSFRRQVRKVIGSIILFMVVYLLLVIAVADAFNQYQFRWYKRMLVEQLEEEPYL